MRDRGDRDRKRAVWGGLGWPARDSYSTAALTHKTFELALADNVAAPLLYATNGTINTVSDFIVSTGVLSLKSAAGGLGAPQGIVSDPGGDFVYVANNATGQVLGYAVGVAGALRPRSVRSIRRTRPIRRARPLFSRSRSSRAAIERG